MNVDIIGGSIAGLSTAIRLKQLDTSISVTIFEKHKNIAFNHNARCCGEAFFSEKNNPWKPAEESIFNHIYRGDLIIGKKTYTDTFPVDRSPAFILNKPMYINQLKEEAKQHHVTFFTGKMIKRTDELDSDIIVDASGCPSRIRKQFSIDHGMKGLTYQETLANCNYFQKNKVSIYYFGDVGYYWIFPRDPKSQEVNLGVGIADTRKISLPNLLNTFKQNMKIQGEPVYHAGGQIPLGLQRPLQKDNVLFVGDAGVGTFPYLGEGIRRALINGEIAAYCIANQKIQSYSKMMMKRFYLWDFIGKMFLRVSKSVSKISEEALFFTLHRYFDTVHALFDFDY